MVYRDTLPVMGRRRIAANATGRSLQISGRITGLATGIPARLPPTPSSSTARGRTPDQQIRGVEILAAHARGEPDPCEPDGCRRQPSGRLHL